MTTPTATKQAALALRETLGSRQELREEIARVAEIVKEKVKEEAAAAKKAQ